MMHCCHQTQSLSLLFFTWLVVVSESHQPGKEKQINNADRSLQTMPGNGNYPNIDFYFRFNEGYEVISPSREDVEALICQINLYLARVMTPTFGNDCLTIYADTVSYSFSATATINEDFPNYPLHVSFFMDGFTTDNGATKFEHEVNIMRYYQVWFNAGSFVIEYVRPTGGMWSEVEFMGFDGRARPKITDSIIPTVDECPNNPSPPDCTANAPDDEDGSEIYPYFDFYFSFYEEYSPSLLSTTDVEALLSTADVEALMCQVNLYLISVVTPILGNNCLAIRTESINYTLREPGTVDDIYPNHSVKVSFFIDGYYTTDNNNGAKKQFKRKYEILRHFTDDFDPLSFGSDYILPIGGIWVQVASFAYEGFGRPRPKAEEDGAMIASVDCPNNPPLPLPDNCTNDLVPFQPTEESRNYYPNIDFYFRFNDGYNNSPPSTTEVEALICQINFYMARVLTPTLLGDTDCITMYVDTINYSFSDTGTINESFPNHPLHLSFFIDGFITTNNGTTQFEQEHDILNYYNFLYAGNFIADYVKTTGGLWSEVEYMGFDLSARPKTDSIIPTVECPNNPPLLSNCNNEEDIDSSDVDEEREAKEDTRNNLLKDSLPHLMSQHFRTAAILDRLVSSSKKERKA